jgi:hypothetical protein
MSTLEVNTVKPISGSNTITLGESGDTIALASGASQTLAVNTPAFRAERSSSQSISNATNTKIQFNDENFDTDNCYDNTTNYRFTPNVAGKYFVYAQISSYGGATDALKEVNPAIRRNGSNFSRSSIGWVSATDYFHVATSYLSAVVDMNGTTDYVEVFQYADATSTPNVQGSGFSYFGAYRIIGA